MFNYKYLDKERPIIRGLYLIDEDNTLVSSLPLRKEIKKLNDSTYTTNDIEFSKKTGLGIDILSPIIVRASDKSSPVGSVSLQLGLYFA